MVHSSAVTVDPSLSRGHYFSIGLHFVDVGTLSPPPSSILDVVAVGVDTSSIFPVKIQPLSLLQLLHGHRCVQFPSRGPKSESELRCSSHITTGRTQPQILPQPPTHGLYRTTTTTNHRLTWFLRPLYRCQDSGREIWCR